MFHRQVVEVIENFVINIMLKVMRIITVLSLRDQFENSIRNYRICEDINVVLVEDAARK